MKIYLKSWILTSPALSQKYLYVLSFSFVIILLRIIFEIEAPKVTILIGATRRQIMRKYKGIVPIVYSQMKNDFKME